MFIQEPPNNKFINPDPFKIEESAHLPEEFIYIESSSPIASSVGTTAIGIVSEIKIQKLYVKENKLVVFYADDLKSEG